MHQWEVKIFSKRSDCDYDPFRNIQKIIDKLGMNHGKWQLLKYISHFQLWFEPSSDQARVDAFSVVTCRPIHPTTSLKVYIYFVLVSTVHTFPARHWLRRAPTTVPSLLYLSYCSTGRKFARLCQRQCSELLIYPCSYVLRRLFLVSRSWFMFYLAENSLPLR